MSQFLLAVYSSDEPREPMTPEQMQAGFALVGALEAAMHAENALLFSARLLEPARTKREPRRARQTLEPCHEPMHPARGRHRLGQADQLGGRGRSHQRGW